MELWNGCREKHFDGTVCTFEKNIGPEWQQGYVYQSNVVTVSRRGTSTILWKGKVEQDVEEKIS